MHRRKSPPARGSVSQDGTVKPLGPNHCASAAGRVQASNTRRRGASKARVRTTVFSFTSLLQIDQRFESAVDHAFGVERHSARLHHAGEAFVLHDPGVHAIALGARPENDVREHHRLAALQLHASREGGALAYLNVVGHAFAELKGAVLAPDLSSLARHVAVGLDLLLWYRHDEPIDVSHDSFRKGWRISGAEKALELDEGCAPALLVPVARRLVEELLVPEHEFGTGTLRPKIDRHQRDALGRTLPGPGEDQPAVGHHLAVHAAHVVDLAVGRTKADVVAPAGAQVDLGEVDARGFPGAEPLLQRLR